MIVKIYSFVSMGLSKPIGLVFPLVSIPSFSKIQGRKKITNARKNSKHLLF